MAFSSRTRSSRVGSPYVSSLPESPASGPAAAGARRTRVAALPASTVLKRVGHLLEQLLHLGLPGPGEGGHEEGQVLVLPHHEAAEDPPRQALLDLAEEPVHHLGARGQVLAPELFEALRGLAELGLSGERVVDERVPAPGVALPGERGREAVQRRHALLPVLPLEVRLEQVRLPALEQGHEGPGRACVLQQTQVGEGLLDQEDGDARAGEAGHRLHLLVDVLVGRAGDEAEEVDPVAAAEVAHLGLDGGPQPIQGLGAGRPPVDHEEVEQQPPPVAAILDLDLVEQGR